MSERLVFREVEKATHSSKPPDSLAILRIAHDAEPSLQKLFLRAVAEVKNGTVLTRVREVIERNDLNAAYEAIPWTQYGEPVLRDLLPLQLRDAYEKAADAAAKTVAREISVSIRFDVTNPRAVDFVRAQAATMIREFGLSNMQTIRGIIERSFREGIDPYKTARMIRDSGIGLTDRMAQAVERFRARQADLTLAQIEARTQRYADKLLRLRARTIARTEIIRASNRGQLDLWRQARDRGLIGNEALKMWITAEDERTCPICSDLDGETVPIEQPFPGGYMHPDAHPNCRCSMTLLPYGKK